MATVRPVATVAVRPAYAGWFGRGLSCSPSWSVGSVRFGLSVVLVLADQRQRGPRTRRWGDRREAGPGATPLSGAWWSRGARRHAHRSMFVSALRQHVRRACWVRCSPLGTPRCADGAGARRTSRPATLRCMPRSNSSWQCSSSRHRGPEGWRLRCFVAGAHGADPSPGLGARQDQHLGGQLRWPPPPHQTGPCGRRSGAVGLSEPDAPADDGTGRCNRQRQQLRGGPPLRAPFGAGGRTIGDARLRRQPGRYT
jgi:hypothetical protein